MSTDKNIDTGKRFSELAAMGEILFHAHDLSVIWGITNKNTLYTTLKRYTSRGMLYRVYNGFYSLRRLTEINPRLLGMKALHRYAYISTETVLSQSGIIMQYIPAITFVSSISRKFTIESEQFVVRKLAAKFLYNDIGITNQDGIPTASPERAVADLLHYNPNAYFDAAKKIDWNIVEKIQLSLGYRLISSKNIQTT